MERQPKQLDRPTRIIREFLDDRHILDRLVNTQGDLFVRRKAEKAMQNLTKDEPNRTPQLLIEIVKDPKREDTVTHGAVILLGHIPLERVSPQIKSEIEVFSTHEVDSEEVQKKVKDLQRRMKISQKLKGRQLPDEHKAKISKGKKGMVRSSEHQAKLNEANRGRRHSTETRAKMSAAHKGKTKSPEHRAKISEAMKRRK